MVFKKMMRALGVGGPSVDTVLDRADTVPGAVLTGQVHILGGDHEVDIEHVALGLVTRVEVESGDSEYDTTVEFQRVLAGGRFRVAGGQNHSLPFQLQIPWETPLTTVFGQHLHGMTLGVRTELSVAKAVDKGDLDGIAVLPLPSQERVLQGFGTLGFQFKRADLERGQIRGTRQTLPFYQEIEFHPPQRLYGRVNEVELTFVTSPQGMSVVIEADKRGGIFHSGHDSIGRFDVTHEQAEKMDWAAQIGTWIGRF